MKYTKRAYVKVWQNYPIDNLEDTTITPYDHEDTNELNSIPAALLYLLEYHASVNSMNESNILEQCPTTEPSDLIGLVKTYRDMPSKTDDFWTPMKSTTTNPKPVNGIPPVSYYPRYRASIWPNTTQHRTNGQPENNTEHYRRIPETHKNNPDPLPYHNRGQHLKHISQNQLAYKHQNNRTDTLHTPKLKTETQPTFNLTEANQ